MSVVVVLVLLFLVSRWIPVIHSVYFPVLSRVTFPRIPNRHIQLHLVCTQYTNIRMFFSHVADIAASTVQDVICSMNVQNFDEKKTCG